MKFIVKVREVAVYQYEIEAGDGLAAEAAALEEHVQVEDINRHFHHVADRTAHAQPAD